MELVFILIAIAALLMIMSSRKVRVENDSTASDYGTPSTGETYMTVVPVAGTAHSEGAAETFAEHAETNAVAIELVAEPDNPHDAYAVKVIGIIPRQGMIREEQRLHIGYLPWRVAYRIGMNNELPRLRATLAYASVEPPEDYDGAEILIDIDHI